MPARIMFKNLALAREGTWVENLSAGGALLKGAPLLPLGSLLQIELELPEGLRLPLFAEVVRQAAHQSDKTVALAFKGLTASVEDTISDAVVRQLERQARLRYPCALVADGQGSDRRTVASDLGDLGLFVFQAATPLDALELATDPENEVGLAVIDTDLGGVRDSHFRCCLKTDAPTSDGC